LFLSELAKLVWNNDELDEFNTAILREQVEKDLIENNDLLTLYEETENENRIVTLFEKKMIPVFKKK